MLYLLLIAHPDDESMFFLPTLLTLLRHRPSPSPSPNDKDRFHILCLSNGNYDGLGQIRTTELHDAVRSISDSYSHSNDDGDGSGMGVTVTVVDDPKLQDGPWEWDVDYIAEEVLGRFLVEMTKLGRKTDDGGGGGVDASCDADDGDEDRKGAEQVTILTFDKGGVSGHINHLYTHLGAVRFQSQLHRLRTTTTESSYTYAQGGNNNNNNNIRTIAQSPNTEVKLMILRTISNPIIKYGTTWPILLLAFVCAIWRTYVADVPLSRKGAKGDVEEDDGVDGDGSVVTYRIFEPRMVWNAMAAHRSQFVWYRRLSVLFSRYTYENTMQIVGDGDGDGDGGGGGGEDGASVMAPGIVAGGKREKDKLL